MDELRVYYNDKGDIICYTCEELEGNYIVVDTQTYAEANPHLKVKDGKLVKAQPSVIVRKLKPSTTGCKCAEENVAIVVSDDYNGKTTTWELFEYEN